MRLAASGPLHNFVTFSCLWFLALSGAGRLLWKDYSSEGRIVQSVNLLSPLADHIEPGRLLTHLDDVFLGGDADLWTDYLTGTEAGDAGRGWCMDRVMFSGLDNAPCARDSGKITFHVTDPPGMADEKCLYPNPILHIPSNPCPCPNSKWVCVRPTREERILRLRMDDGTYDGEVLLWTGDRRAVLNDVRVGREGARAFGPVVRWTSMFFEYMSTIALSLFLFNLLPLPYTDGSQLLKAALTYQTPKPPPTVSLRATLSTPTRPTSPSINIRISQSQERQHAYAEAESDDDEYADEGGREGGGRREEVWKRRLRRGVEGGVMVLGFWWVAGWAMLALLRSS